MARTLLGGAVTVPDNLTVTGTVSIGSGTAIKKHLAAQAAWDPPNLVNNASVTVNITVTGAAVGDICGVSFTTVLPAGMYFAVPQVTATNTVTVTLINNSGSTQDLASGTLKVQAWQYN